MHQTTLCTFQIAAQLRLLPALTACIARLGESLGLPSEEATGLAQAASQAVRNAVEHGLEHQGQVEVEIRESGDRLVLLVRDRGLPFDPELLSSTGRGGMGRQAMHQFCDEVEVHCLGPEGMEVQLVKRLPPPAEHVQEALGPEPPAAAVGPLEYRLVQPSDSVQLTRCAYRTYGYTYVPEVYYPEMLSQGIEYGYLLGMGCFHPEGEMIGFLGVIKEDPEDGVGELGLGMVDPRYRGQGIFEHLLQPTLDHARQLGMEGLFAETVTVHTITQKSKHKLGWRETGAVLAYIGHREFKSVAGSAPELRQSIVLFYQNFSSRSQAIYLPERHRSLLQKIIDVQGVSREILPVPAVAPDGQGHLEVKVNAAESVARLSLDQWGEDSLAQLQAQLHDLCLHRVDLILLDLPLTHPATANFCPQIEAMGFFLAGILFALREGQDVLRMQYLNNVQVEPERIQTYSEFARELVDYVLAERERLAQGSAR